MAILMYSRSMHLQQTGMIKKWNVFMNKQRCTIGMTDCNAKLDEDNVLNCVGNEWPTQSQPQFFNVLSEDTVWEGQRLKQEGEMGLGRKNQFRHPELETCNRMSPTLNRFVECYLTENKIFPLSVLNLRLLCCRPCCWTLRYDRTLY